MGDTVFAIQLFGAVKGIIVNKSQLRRQELPSKIMDISYHERTSKPRENFPSKMSFPGQRVEGIPRQGSALYVTGTF